MCQCEGVSSVSGQWKVEEVGGGDGMEKVRRLVFEDSCRLAIVQTEMRLKPGMYIYTHIDILCTLGFFLLPYFLE